MEVPSPSSEENERAVSGSDTAESAPKKRAPRTRSRLYRAKGAKPAKSARAGGDEASPPAPATNTETAPSRSAPVERVEEPAAPAAAAAPPAPAPAPVYAPAPDQAPATEAPAGTPAGGESYGQGTPAGEGGGGQQFQPGGGKFGRWRDKKFRGGGKWNKHPNAGGGGGGGGGGPKYPAQPLPPKQEVHYGDLPDPARFQDLAALETLAGEIGPASTEPLWLNKLYALSHAELVAKAREFGAKLEGVPNRKQLLAAIFAGAAEHKVPLCDLGWLDLTDRGHGFIVHADVNYRLYPEDAFVPETFIRKFGLKRGHQLEVQVQAPQGNDRCPAVVRLRQVMGGDPAAIAAVQPFEELTPYYPLQRIWLEQPGAKDVSMRMVDIITPIGFGQRGLIVAPPRTGKTILLQNIANSVAANSPAARLIILLVDERPEEVTDFRRHCQGEVISSTFDETPESHVHCAEMVIEKARRLVEQGEQVVILLDSITRLARAYNALASNSGKIMSGGLEATALQKPKRFFGSARNIEGAGSLTILGTALVDTGSRMDEIIFEEFKGTGNMELHLDRDLVNKRIFPALNIDKSGTRKEELIYHPDELARIYGLRRAMQGVPAADSLDMLIQRLKKTKTNAEFLMSLNR